MNENRKDDHSKYSFPSSLMQELAPQLTSIISKDFPIVNLDSFKSKQFDSDLFQKLIELTQAVSSSKARIISQVSSLLEKYSKPPPHRESPLTSLKSLSTDLSFSMKSFQIKMKQYATSSELFSYHLTALQDALSQVKEAKVADRFSKVFQLKEEMHSAFNQMSDLCTNHHNQVISSIEQYIQQTHCLNDRGDIKVNTSPLLTSQSLNSNSTSSIRTNGKSVAEKKSAQHNSKKVLIKNRNNIMNETKLLSSSTDGLKKKPMPCAAKQMSSSPSPYPIKTIESASLNTSTALHYKVKYQEQVSEVSKLKQSLIREQIEKSQLKNELLKQKAKPILNNDSSFLKLTSKQLSNGMLINSTSASTSSPSSSLQITSSSTMKGLRSKLDKLAEMILRFSSSMTALHDTVFKKNGNFNESKVFYEQLKQKLLQISNDYIDARSSIDRAIPIEDIPLKDDDRRNSDISSDSLNRTISKSDISYLIKENNQLKEKNNSLIEYNHQLTEKIITFRNMDGQQCQFQCPSTSTPPAELNDLNELKRKVSELQLENRQLKERIISPKANSILREDSLTNDSLKEMLNEKEAQLKDIQLGFAQLKGTVTSLEAEISSLKEMNAKEVEHLKEVIEGQNKETQQLQSSMDANSNSSGLLKKLKQTHCDNVNQLKQLYEKMLNEKTNSVNRHIEEARTIKQEMITLKEQNSQLETKLRDSYINHEVELSLLSNDKIKLEIQIEELTSRLSILTEEQEHSKACYHPVEAYGASLTELPSHQYEAVIDKLTSSIAELESKLALLQEERDSAVMKKNKEVAVYQEKIKEYQSIINSKDRAIIDVRKESNQLKQSYIDEITEKNNEIENITQNHQNDLTELNIAIIKLRSQITKLQEENISLTFSQRSQRSVMKNLFDISKFHLTFQRRKSLVLSMSNEENDSLKKEITELRNQIALLSNDRNNQATAHSHSHSNVSCDESYDSGRLNLTSPNFLSMLNQGYSTSNQIVANDKEQLLPPSKSKGIVNKQTEELIVLKSKLRSTLDENKQLTKRIMDLEHTSNKIKEEYISVLRAAFEKFVAEIQLPPKAKEYATIVFRMMNYTEEDINDIYVAMGKKKGGNYFGFLRNK